MLDRHSSTLVSTVIRPLNSGELRPESAECGGKFGPHSKSSSANVVEVAERWPRWPDTGLRLAELRPVRPDTGRLRTSLETVGRRSPSSPQWTPSTRRTADGPGEPSWFYGCRFRQVGVVGIMYLGWMSDAGWALRAGGSARITTEDKIEEGRELTPPSDAHILGAPHRRRFMEAPLADASHIAL